jgi:hypothetical protein
MLEATMSDGKQREIIDPSQYSALTTFFRGYLHQDAPIEYHSPVAAAQAFRRDVDERESIIVHSELDRLLYTTKGSSVRELQRILEELGCSWHFTNREELENVRDALK